MDVMDLRRRIMLNEPHIVTPASASLQNFRTDLVAPLKECKVHFSPVQEGTGDPSPSNVRPIKRWTGVEVYRAGKNLLNANAQQQSPDNTNMMPANKRIFTPNTYCVGMSWSNYYVRNNVTSYSVSNGTITVMNGNVYGLGYPVRVTPGQAYFLSATTTNGRANIAYFASDGTYVSGVSTDVLNSSFTAPSDVRTAVVIFYSHSGEAIFSNIQLELGSTATAYEPYSGETITGEFIYELSGGFVDITNQQYTMNSMYLKLWTAIPSLISGKFFRYSGWRSIIDTSASIASPCYKTVSTSEEMQNTDYSIRLTSNGYIYVHDSRFTDTSSITDYLENNKFGCLVSLSSSFSYDMPINSFKTFRGTNNIWSNANGNIELAYWGH